MCFEGRYFLLQLIIISIIIITIIILIINCSSEADFTTGQRACVWTHATLSAVCFGAPSEANAWRTEESHWKRQFSSKQTEERSSAD